MLRHVGFVPFLRAQSTTLVDVHLQSIGFPDGNWTEPLNIIREMQKLDRIFLNILLESTSYSSAKSTSSKTYKTGFLGHFRFSTHEAIGLALEALCADIHFVSYGLSIEDSDGRIYPWMIDLRKARAAGLGKIVSEEKEDSSSESEESTAVSVYSTP